ncbi:protein archease [Halobacteriales archaeon QS_5_70_17]|nr:MAG: protein archease [Halobacteriales archaeon QS_5_70_17]
MGYELLSHPADVRFRATGPTLAEAFVSAVDAFADLVGGPAEGNERRSVRVESEDREALLFDFLGDLILLQEVEGVAVVGAEAASVERADGGYGLEATVVGAPIDPESPLFDIKSPTYNGMRVEETDDGWTLEATLDV